MIMKFKTNENFNQLKQNYLFSDIAKKVRAYSSEHPDAKIIRLGIGDVTLPLAGCVVEAMKKAADEMGRKETFRGYAPEAGYDFLREAIVRHYADFGVTLSPSEVFVSDGAKSDVGNIVDILGDNPILIPDPVYPVYMDSNIMAGRRWKATWKTAFSPPRTDFRAKGTSFISALPTIRPVRSMTARGFRRGWTLPIAPAR